MPAIVYISILSCHSFNCNCFISLQLIYIIFVDLCTKVIFITKSKFVNIGLALFDKITKKHNIISSTKE